MNENDRSRVHRYWMDQIAYSSATNKDMGNGKGRSGSPSTIHPSSTSREKDPSHIWITDRREIWRLINENFPELAKQLKDDPTPGFIEKMRMI